MYYGDKRESKVNVCHTLMALNWKIYGYHEDQSDSMTDYYCPASWDGIATKSGYTLCVDIQKYDLHNSGKAITKYVCPNVNFQTNAKIDQLNKLASDNAATDGEKVAAFAAIERLQKRIKEEQEQAQARKEILYTFPVFQENPPHCNWHIEKDGVIVAKGNGAFQFHGLPRWVDHMTGESKEDYYTRRAWTLSEDEQKDLKKFQSFIHKVESVANLKLGENDAGEDTYKKITVTEYKKEIKPFPVVLDNLSQELDRESCFILNANFNYGCFKGNVYRIKDDKGGYIQSLRLNGKLEKELTGRATTANRFNCSFENFKKWVDKGAISIVELREVKTPYEVEKVVKVESEKPKAARAEKQSEPTANAEYTFEIREDIDTRDNSAIWVVTIKEKLDRDEYIKSAEYMKTKGGYYSKFKHGFIFKSDPTSTLNAPEQKLEETNGEAEQKAASPSSTYYADKINKQIESLEKKVAALSGDYKSNTYKRMREAETREGYKDGWREDIHILRYLLAIVEAGERALTPFEAALINNTFRADIDVFCNRHAAFKNGRGYSTDREIEFPVVDPRFGEWWNKEVPQKAARLKKGGITNTKQLIEAVEYYGEIKTASIPKVDPTAQKIKRLEAEAKMQQKGDIQFTPQEVAALMVEYANISEDSRVLEPSAGIGSIADEARKITTNIDVIECMGNFRELLMLKGYNLVGYDFLEYTLPNDSEAYDAILMNPPFSNNQDIQHIKHAYGLLKAGGVLVAIASPHWSFANDKASVNFRDWLEEKEHTTEDLNSGTFERTGVCSKLIVIYKEAEEQEQEEKERQSA